MGVAIPDMPTCEVCQENESVVCCDDALFRCTDCCSEDEFDSMTGEAYDYDWGWTENDDDEEET